MSSLDLSLKTSRLRPFDIFYTTNVTFLNAHCQNRLWEKHYLPDTPPDPGIVEAGKLNYYVLGPAAGWNTKHRKNRREIGAGAYKKGSEDVRPLRL